ncbi:MAG: YraN family protein [Candidatus Paceibacterota bacterium]|jgi:Holliday junction resolvase-like predicted endonuclease
MKLNNSEENVGRVGELIVARNLEKHGHRIITMNYRKKWGEIDVISQKERVTHFIEVKTVSRETSRGDSLDAYSPEENVHPKKLKRLARTIQSFLLENNLTGAEWQLDVAGVLLDVNGKKARIRMTENVVI